uniref:NB-ARC domain-containing protein n=1 Tax=Fagus sylvatica TaxID=28930 RepID=A0A2N9FP73_FAGSY
MAGLGGAIQVLLEYADSTEVREFFGVQNRNYDLLKKLKTELPSLAAVVDDAEEKQNRSEAVRAWLHQLRDDVYDAEDFMDEIRTEALRHRLETGSQTKKDDASGEKLFVIPIMGEVGIGKTTLARLVFSDHKVSQHFYLKAWVQVPDTFDELMVTKAIFESLTSQPCHPKDLKSLQVILQESLSAANGSSVIITTHQSLSSYPKLEAIGRQIAHKCHGLPLAVRALGAALYFKRQVEEWSAILDSLENVSLSSKCSDIVNLSFKLSYYQLPAHLKRCFAYCSILPPSNEFQKERLVLLWMAEGLLNQPRADHRMEENMVSAKDAAEARLVEKTYLDELVLEWGDDTVDPENNRDVLEQLVPHTNLKKLSIKFYVGTRFPHWLGDFSFSNMVFLRLSNCKNCLDLPPLGQLSSLKVLIIEWMNAVKRVGPEFYGIDKPFQSLETLTFDGMMEWEEWVSFEVNGGEFPFLRELCIRRCPKLKNLPKIFPSIVKVEIFESMELVTTLIIDELSRKRLLHYNDKVLFISEDKVTSFSELMSIFTNTGATESSTTLGAMLSLYFRARGAPESSLLKTQDAAESSLPTTQGSTESSLPITQGATEYSLPITLSATEYSLPITQGATEYSLPITQGATESTEDDVRNNTWSNQDGLQDLSFESIKVSRMSQLMGLTGIHSLKIEGCDALEFIPVEVMDRNPLLQHLYFINCGSFKSFPRGHPPAALKFLYIQNCKKLEFLPPTKRMHQFALEHLCIGSSCDSLKFLPLDFFPELRSLSIWDCANLHSLSVTDGIQKDLTCLEALEIRDCPNLVSFPNGGLPTPNLTSIWISNCKNLKEMPHKLHTLNSLESMLINNCPKLISLPEGGLPSNLSILCITFCDELMPRMEWGLHRLDCLSRLEIEGGCKNLVSFPEEKLLPSNLNSLRISGVLNLEYLNYKGLQHLTALKTLEISCCNKLRSFPEESLPSSLSFLCINECSLLESKLHNKRKRFG